MHIHDKGNNGYTNAGCYCLDFFETIIIGTSFNLSFYEPFQVYYLVKIEVPATDASSRNFQPPLPGNKLVPYI